MELNEKVMIFMVAASELFKKKSSAILKDYGLTFSHYKVLRYLASCEQGQDSIGNVGRRLMVSGANMTGIAKRMEKALLVERRNNVTDERLIMLQITQKGREMLGAIRGIQEQHGDVYLKTYSQEQKEEMLSVLRHIVRRGKQP